MDRAGVVKSTKAKRGAGSMLLAGIFISIACMAYQACFNHIIGSIAFSAGLVLVIVLDAELFTGKIGYARKANEIPRLALMLAMNMLAAAAMGLLFSGDIIDKKILGPLPEAFSSAIVCGVLVYAAVEMWKRTKNIAGIAIPTAAFILIGGEHCIADAFWIAAKYDHELYDLLWLAVVVAGNIIGAKLIDWLMRKGEKSC